MHKDLEEAYDKCEYFTKENEELKQQLERLTNAFDEQKKARESMLQQVEDFDKDNTYLRARITQLENELEQLQQFEKINIELRIIIERHEHDIKLLEEEKLSLKQMLEQKDSLLKILSQQSEQSVKMLHQRQEAIEKLENHPYNGIDIEEYLRLQSNLKEVFISEGELLHSEYLDAKRLISIVRELREQIHQNEQLKSEISIQREDKRQVNEKFQHNIQRIDKLEQTKSDLISQLQSMKRELDDCYYKINHLEGKNLMQESNSSPLRLEMNRQYDIRSSSNNNYNSSFSYNNSSYSSSNVNNNYQFEQQIQTIQSENSILREQLLISQKETVQARDELKIAQGKMQREFSSLYLSVQELNKLDAMKDKSIQDLISDRDRAIIERDIAREKYTVLAKEHKEIQQELHVMVTVRSM